MFKSSFAKHICSFVLIVFMSFLIISGIIGTLVSEYADDTRRQKLDSASEIIIEYVSDEAIENVEIATINGLLPKTVETIVKTDPQYDILIANKNHTIILSTVTDGEREVSTGKNLGSLPIDLFEGEILESGRECFVHHGDLDGFLPEKSLVFMKPIIVDGKVDGYVVAIASTIRENNLVVVTRKAILNSALWVMLQPLSPHILLPKE